MWILWLAACASKLDDTSVRRPTEGTAEYDPPRPHDTGRPPTTDDTESESETAAETEETEPVETEVTEETEETEQTTETEPPPPDPLEVCYLGPARDDAQCVTLVQPSGLGSDYDYPDPLYGDPNYREPIAWLDLADLDPTLSLAPNFVLEELAQEWKGQYGVVQPHLIDRLQDMRDELGPLVVNSGYRNPGYNASIGGVTYSRHMYGDSADLDPSEVDLDTMADTCYDHGAGYVGYYETHIHCDWRDDAVDVAFFGASLIGGAPAPMEPHDAWVEVDPDGVWWAPAIGWDEGEPLREWTFFDADGAVLGASTARSARPPPGAARGRVVVGRAVERWF